MTVRTAVVLTAAAIAAQQTFRSTADLVMVDVSVRSGDRAVPSLAAADFVLTDNGVRQRVESVEAAAVPIDLTLVVDVSGNRRRPRLPRADPHRTAAALEDEVRQIASILRPSDRLRLLAVDRYVRELWPFLPARELPPIRDLEIDGLAATYEGLAAALLHPVEPARRHVVVIRTKGVDTVSSISASDVGAIAARSDALLHVVIMETALYQDSTTAFFQCGRMGICWPTNRPWMPTRRQLVTPPAGRFGSLPLPDGVTLKAGVAATGGGWHQTALLSEPTAASTFRKTFDDFRSGYILRYTPQGVTRGGWHRIDVTLVKPQGHTVRARRGYGIDETPPPAPPAPIVMAPRTLPELTEAYARGAFPRVATGLRQTADPTRLLREFNEGGNPWPATPRREAAFAVELAEAGLFANGDDARKEAVATLERFVRLVRHPLGPSEFERQWLATVVTLVQGAMRPAMAKPIVDRALARFPADPQFVLARAIVSEQALIAAPKPGAAYEEARRNYEAAMGLPAVANEARIRLALRLHLGQQSTAALALLDAVDVDPVQAPNLAYLRQLFRGHALGSLDRTAEAIAAYREALLIVPPGQAARVALMRRLLESGSRADAEMLADLVQTERSPALDPWWMYWQGQYRLYPQALARLRELGRN